jgi:methylenetetrahydrofolate reductase (NADPH)
MSTASLFSVPTAAPTISFELYPPRTPKGERDLPATVAALAAVQPEFFSVTYGASGRTRDASGALLAHILEETDVAPIAHLTCVGASEADLDDVVAGLLQIGVRDFLALRGDPPEGEPDWRPHPEGYTTASELVALLRRAEARAFPDSDGDARSQLSISVAAYPGGSFDVDGVPVIDPTTIEALLAKQAAGADFAITQMFFDPDSYAAFVRTARDAGVHIPIVPGILPLTDPRRLRRMEVLSGVPVPQALLADLESAPDREEQYRRGLAASVDLVHGVLEAGAPGLHLYTFNSARPALDLLAAARLRSVGAESH